MATIHRFEDLEVWQKSRDICKFVFKLTCQEKFSKDFALKDQIKRSSGSVMDNIAEGFERGGNKEFVNFLTFSKGSLGEVRSQTYRAFDYGYIAIEEFDFLIKETVSLTERLGKFISYLKNSEFKGIKFKKDKQDDKNQ
ncbi:MAG: four helix bundle protein [Paludibacter sp.]|nr:four helix bundle protein [Paludibacter sp.]